MGCFWSTIPLQSDIFISRSSDGSSSFLTAWNGVKWSTLGADFSVCIRMITHQSFFTTGSSFDQGTTVAQLTMVPVQTTHTANGMIESDRVLMISGSLSTSSGNSSSALYDGQTLIPYIISTSASGTSGSVSSLFHSFKTFSFNRRSEFSSSLEIW